MLRYFTHMSVSKCGPMRFVERISPYVQIVASVGCFIFAYLTWRLSQSQQPPATNPASPQKGEPIVLIHYYPSALIILSIALFVIGVALLVMAIRTEVRIRKSKHLPMQTEQIPSVRPKIIPVKWDKPPDAFHGLFIRNDGAPAFDISVDEPVLIGQSRLGFWNRIYPGLTKEQGELFIDCHIELIGVGHGTTGGALRDLMVKADVESLPLTIRYRDLERTYLTRCSIVREVWGNGLRISSIQQELLGDIKSSDDTTALPVSTPKHNSDVPDVFLEWALPNPEFPGISSEKEIIVVNRSTTDYAYNIVIAPLTLATTLKFGKISELKPQGRIPVEITFEGMKEPHYKPLIRFLMINENREVAEQRGFITEKQSGLARYVFSVPLSMTYSGRSGTCTTDITMQFDDFNGAKFEFVRRA